MTVDVTTDSTRVGWIGTGVMGTSMCGHLMDAGFATTVYTRTPAKADDLCQRGATCMKPSEYGPSSHL